MICSFCGTSSDDGTCGACGRDEHAVVGLGPAAGTAAARLCQTLASTGTVFDDLRSAVAETTRVLDAEGVGRLAATKLALAGDVETALAEAWGYRREDVTIWGEPLGSFELPAAILGRTTRRVDRRDGAIAFTIVEDPWTGGGFVGVWDLDGRLLWAPPQARPPLRRRRRRAPLRCVARAASLAVGRAPRADTGEPFLGPEPSLHARAGQPSRVDPGVRRQGSDHPSLGDRRFSSGIVRRE